jgi:septum formation protein
VSLAPSEPMILASSSPTRARLLADAGLPILVDPAAVDEEEIRASFQSEGRDAAACAAALAEAKATRVSTRHAGSLVLGADQILECGGRWLEKPRDPAAARAQLAYLRGKRHTLVTAAAVVLNGAVIWQTIDRAELTMRAFSDGFLDGYVAASGAELLASVGAYQLESLGAQLFERVEGDFFTVLGLPLLPLLAFLRGHGALQG